MMRDPWSSSVYESCRILIHHERKCVFNLNSPYLSSIVVFLFEGLMVVSDAHFLGVVAVVG